MLPRWLFGGGVTGLKVWDISALGLVISLRKQNRRYAAMPNIHALEPLGRFLQNRNVGRPQSVSPKWLR